MGERGTARHRATAPGARRGRAHHPALGAAVVGAVVTLAACGGTPAAGGTAAGGAAAPHAGGTAAPARPTPARPTPPQPVTLSFAGDVHFEGPSRTALTGGLRAITSALSAADLTVVNLETAVTDRGTPAPKQFTFRAPATAFPALKTAGVDVVTMANNHGMDYGRTGLADSLAAARAAGMPVVGAGSDEDAAFAAHVAVVKGQRVAVIGATQVLDDELATAWTAGPGTPGLASAKDVARTVAAVRAARAQADVVVVDLHWGSEQVACPTGAQTSLAQALVDAGADVVVGSHAHVLLGGGLLGRAYVHYGLGNAVFYATSPAQQASGVLTLTLTGRTVTASSWAPARISGGVPVPLSGAAATAATAAWERLRGCTGLAASP